MQPNDLNWNGVILCRTTYRRTLLNSRKWKGSGPHISISSCASCPFRNAWFISIVITERLYVLLACPLPYCVGNYNVWVCVYVCTVHILTSLHELQSEARFPFKRNRLCCVNENRKKCKRLCWQAANHGCHCFDRGFLLTGACVCCVKTQAIAFQWKPGFTEMSYTVSDSLWTNHADVV